MRYCDIAQPAVKSCFVVVACLLMMGPIQAGAVQSGNSTIEVLVCPTENESFLTPTQPQSDSVVNEPKVAISGQVGFISQVDFFIDDVYNNTIALGYSATEFESTVMLSPGTHTIKLVATDSCSHTIHTDIIVITYQPKAQPSIGEDVVTEVGNTVRNPPAVTPPRPVKNPILDIIDRTITPPVTAVADSLDITSSAELSEATRIANTARAVLFVTGLTVTVVAAHMTALSTLPQSFMFMKKYRRGGTGMVALLGAGMMLLVFIL